ncbi:MAG: hypothetical protein Q8S32_10850 [Burkholderiaceae bacterium]|nr:hypothetical protein [Burkholderiaceae bacterium]
MRQDLWAQLVSLGSLGLLVQLEQLGLQVQTVQRVRLVLRVPLGLLA